MATDVFAENVVMFSVLCFQGTEMKILITGVAGFLGSCFSDYILATQPDVTVIGIDNLCTGFRENVDERVKFYEFDLVDHVALENVFQENDIDYIVHMAAFAAEALSAFVRRHTYMTNVIASTNLINCAINHGIKRFLFTSSIASYGDLTPPFEEDMTPKPADIYGLSKFVTSEDLRIAREHHKLEYVIVMPFNIYGPKQALNSAYRNVLGIFMNKLLDGKRITIYGDGTQRRAFSYIDDLLQPLWKALTDPSCANQTYNLGSDRSYSVNELAQTCIKVVGHGDIRYLEPRHEVANAYSDVSKAKRELGYEVKTDLETGIARMWEWARSQPRRPVEKFKELEVTKGLYSFWK